MSGLQHTSQLSTTRNRRAKNARVLTEAEIMHGWRRALEKRLAECEAEEATKLNVAR